LKAINRAFQSAISEFGYQNHYSRRFPDLFDDFPQWLTLIGKTPR